MSNFDHGLLRAVSYGGTTIDEWSFSSINTQEEVAEYIQCNVRRSFKDCVLLFKEVMPDGQVNHYVWDNIMERFNLL